MEDIERLQKDLAEARRQLAVEKQNNSNLQAQLRTRTAFAPGQRP